VGVTIGVVETNTDTIERAHRTLGLNVFASRSEIKKAWRLRARETHPDLGGSATAFREVQTAAKFLLGEGVREFYQAQDQHAATARSATTKTTNTTTGATTKTTASATTAQSATTVVLRPKNRRHKGLIVAAIFGCFVAPHYQQLGFSDAPLRVFSEVMHTTDWFFFFIWWGLKRPVAQ